MLDKYKRIKKISSHENRKFSNVYLCQTNSNKLVTCKVIDKSRVKNLTHLSRIKREGEFCPNILGIPKLVDFFETENEYIIVRNFIEGKTPDEICKTLWRKKKNLFIENFFEKSSIILNKFHQKGWIHLDLKPSNFIIDKFNNIYLIDFGLLQNKNDFIQSDTLFSMGYSAPEVVLNFPELISYKSDYFSLGVTLWTLFTGEIPLSQSNPAFMINLQITHPIPNHRKIPKKWFQKIENLSYKSSFPLPPNRLPKSKVREILQQGVDRRIDNLSSL